MVTQFAGLPGRGSVVVLLLGLGAIGCRSWDPVAYDFRSATSDETEAPITDAPITTASMRRFLAEHGPNAVPFLSQVLMKEACTQDGSGLRQAWTAVRAMRALRDHRSREALEAVQDVRCGNPALHWQVLRALAELDGRPTLPIALAELASEQAAQDVHLLVEILSSRDPTVGAGLLQMAETATNPRSRTLYRFLAMVMATPELCRLNPNGSVFLGSRSGYLCQYTCPAADLYHQEQQDDVCAPSIPISAGAMAERRLALTLPEQ